MQNFRISLIGIVITICIGVLYVPAFDIYLRGDDFEWLNSAYFGWTSPTQLLERINNFFRPVVKFSYLLNYTLSPTYEPLYNVTTIGIHLINVFFLYLFIYRITQQWNVAALAAIAFGASSLYGEVTLWSAGRPDSLLLVCMLPILLIVSSVKQKMTWTQHVGVACLTIGALGSKETWVLLPLITVSFLCFVQRTHLIRAIKMTWTMWGLLGFYVSIFILSPLLSATTSPTDYAGSTLYAGFIKFCYLLARYCGLESLYFGHLWQSILILLCLVGGGWWLVKTKNSLACWGMGWMLLTMGISLPIEYAPSRYNYLPLVGFGIVIAAVYMQVKEIGFFRKNPISFTACLLALGVWYVSYHAIMLQWEIQDYKKYGTFHQRLVEMYKDLPTQFPPETPILFMNYGTQKPISELERSYKGYPKLLFKRKSAMWELMYFDTFINYLNSSTLHKLAPLTKDVIDMTLALKHPIVVIFTDQDFRILYNDDANAHIQHYYSMQGHLPEYMKVYQRIAEHSQQ